MWDHAGRAVGTMPVLIYPFPEIILVTKIGAMYSAYNKSILTVSVTVLAPVIIDTITSITI